MALNWRACWEDPAGKVERAELLPCVGPHCPTVATGVAAAVEFLSGSFADEKGTRINELRFAEPGFAGT